MRNLLYWIIVIQRQIKIKVFTALNRVFPVKISYWWIQPNVIFSLTNYARSFRLIRPWNHSKFKCFSKKRYQYSLCPSEKKNRSLIRGSYIFFKKVIRLFWREATGYIAPFIVLNIVIKQKEKKWIKLKQSIYLGTSSM